MQSGQQQQATSGDGGALPSAAAVVASDDASQTDGAVVVVNDGRVSTPYQLERNRVLRGLIAGGVMGGLESLIMYPSIYVKTQMQLDYGRSFFGYKWAQFALRQVGATDILRVYKGPVDCIRKTYAARGLAGFYRGSVITATASVPKVGVRFAATEAIVSNLQVDERGHHSLGQTMFAGSIAAILETLLIGAPMETIMTQMIKDTTQAKPKLKGAIHAFGYILLKHGEAFAGRYKTLERFLPSVVIIRFRLTGVPGLYRGTTSIVGRQIFTQVSRLTVYEVGRDAYRLKHPDKDLPILMVAGLGALSGVISVLCTAPMDIVKTRMQGLFWNNYRSHWDCARKLWRKEGPLVFFRGSAPRMVRVCIDMAYSSLFYEFMCSYMERSWK